MKNDSDSYYFEHTIKFEKDSYLKLLAACGAVKNILCSVYEDVNK